MTEFASSLTYWSLNYDNKLSWVNHALHYPLECCFPEYFETLTKHWIDKRNSINICPMKWLVIFCMRSKNRGTWKEHVTNRESVVYVFSQTIKLMKCSNNYYGSQINRSWPHKIIDYVLLWHWCSLKKVFFLFVCPCAVTVVDTSMYYDCNNVIFWMAFDWKCRSFSHQVHHII